MSIRLRVIKSRSVPVQTAALREFARRLLQSEHVQAGEINLVFVDDNYIQRLNEQFLDIGAPTDVLSFPLESRDGYLEGEVYVSVDTAVRQSHEYRVSVEEEIFRLVAHGLLHLVGYRDYTPSEKAEMTRKEDEYLGLLQEKTVSRTT